MNDASNQAARALALPTEAYLQAGDAAFADVVRQLQPPSGPPGMPPPPPIFALGAAPTIEIARTDTWPGALARRYSGARPWEVRPESNLVFVVSELRTGRVRAAGSFTSDKRMQTPEPSQSGTPPSDFDRKAMMHGIERLNVPPLFGKDWPSNAFAVTALYFDWRSNTVVAERRPAPDPGPEPFRAPSRQLAAAAPAEPGAGLLLSVPTTAPAGAPLNITLRISARPEDVALVRSARPGTGQDDGRVIVASVLFVRLDDTRPAIATVALPARMSAGRIEGQGGFDAAAVAGAPLQAGEYRVYAVTGRTVVGPSGLVVRP